MIRQKLGVDSYSLRFQGWSAHEYLTYSAGLNLDTVQFSDRANLASLEPGYLAELTAEAKRLHIEIELGMGSFDRFAASFKIERGTAEEQLGVMIEAAARVGSPVVRCFLGDQRDRNGVTPFFEHLAECRRVLHAVAPLARDRGVKIAVENHGGVDVLARELRTLIEDVGFDVVGACLDTGNPAYGGEDPEFCVEIMAEYSITTHFRDTAVWEAADGAMAQWVGLGEGNVDLRACLATLATKAPDCPIDLEIITGAPPSSVPFLAADGQFWRANPDVPARDFARFVRLARNGTSRGIGPRRQVVAPRAGDPPADLFEALRVQQRADFEASVRYARGVLGLGRNGRAES